MESRRQTILVVEDDAILRGILAEALTDEGYVVLTADDGEPALAISSTLRLDLVVTDLLLPVMDGLELADRLSRLEAPPPVLFISGVISKRSVPGPVLTKPFGPSAFLEQVAHMLPSAQHH